MSDKFRHNIKDYLTDKEVKKLLDLLNHWERGKKSPHNSAGAGSHFAGGERKYLVQVWPSQAKKNPCTGNKKPTSHTPL